MNPLIKKWIGSILRSGLLLIGGGYLVREGIWTEAEADEYVTAFVAVVVPVVWSLWEKYKSQQRQTTTLAAMNNLTGLSVPNVTQRDIETIIKDGDSAPAMASKDDAPRMSGSGDGMSSLRKSLGVD